MLTGGGMLALGSSTLFARERGSPAFLGLVPEYTSQ